MSAAYRPGKEGSAARRAARLASQLSRRRKTKAARASSEAAHAAEANRRFEKRAPLLLQKAVVEARRPGPLAETAPASGIPSPGKALLLGLCAITLTALLTFPQLRPRALSIALAERRVVEEMHRAAATAPITPPAPASGDLGPLATVAAGNRVSPARAQSEPAIAAMQRTTGAVAAAVPAYPEFLPAHPSAPPTSPGLPSLAERAPHEAPADASFQIALVAREDEAVPSCTFPEADPAPASLSFASPAEFGRALAAEALKQTRSFTVYSDKYRSLPFPMGDVPRLYGVCTDVVIRAYRALGIDLQARVHAARVGSGDASIAHRRTFTLRRYFSSRGTSLPVSDFAEDYLPGDIVTYYRPQNSGSRDHIAIVAGEIGPSGRPMIIHNRGWGPQLEDALFVNKMTGHYRYTRAQDQISLAMMVKNTPAAPALKDQKHAVQKVARVRALRSALKARMLRRQRDINQ